MSNEGILILMPDLNLPGGVTNYYRILNLHEYENISYFFINNSKPESTIATGRRLLKNYVIFLFKLVKYKYRVVLINPSLDKRSFYRDMVFIILTRLLKKKTIVFFHGWLESYEQKIKTNKFLAFLFQVSYAKVGTYVVLGNVFKKKLIALGVARGTEFFIETMIADDGYLPPVDFNEKLLSFKREIKILFLSRILKEKGIYIAIEAFKEFAVKFPKIRASLIIAGDGPELSEAKLYVQKKQIANVSFLGNIYGERKMKVLLESHIMLFPSFTEGLPNVILEGMLYGMPIISRHTGGIPEIIKQDINGFLTESYDPYVFFSFLSKLALDSNLYLMIAKANHAEALRNFSSEKVKRRIIKILGGNTNSNNLKPA